MENLPEEITINCLHCLRLVAVPIDELKEENSFCCPHCFSRTPVDVDKLLKRLEELIKEVRELRDQ